MISSSITYDDDFFAWTQHQADALRRIAKYAGNEVDIEHVAEEIEDLGKRDLREVRSCLELLIIHLLKVIAFPASPDVAHWRSEIRTFRRSAEKTFTPGMRQLIDVAELWSEGRKEATDALKDQRIELIATAVCPFTLDDLLAKDFDVDAAMARLTGPPGSTDQSAPNCPE